jgi:hypothetical protein
VDDTANVSVAFYPIEVLPAVFRYGFAMPFYNVSSTVRTIIFGTKNESMYPRPINVERP